MKNLYINLTTGEIIKKHTFFKAKKYFKKDSRRLQYDYCKRDVIKLWIQYY